MLSATDIDKEPTTWTLSVCPMLCYYMNDSTYRAPCISSQLQRLWAVAAAADHLQHCVGRVASWARVVQHDALAYALVPAGKQWHNRQIRAAQHVPWKAS